MSTPQGPHGPYQFAINTVMVAKRDCWCEYVDIGVGDQKVHEHPECPRCTREGEAAWFLEQLLPHILKAEHDRVEKLLHERIEKVTYGSNWDQDQGYKQGLADAVGIMRYVPKEGAPDRWHL
ncbi:hypothetical protein FXF51_56880 [Nonomuraea sp. PA05]|uniref:hypothetical protein n=1 Tax=Nonomuraea sp. PA05 TaxID=2604466 RepID=UPI0011D6B771|nr:hypothetical protein [Nonomuraea sp. PA05]TYB50256.1 hypothetical protein FXF51_56880 [Nonomuraea sp. PA05]